MSEAARGPPAATLLLSSILLWSRAAHYSALRT